MDLNLSILALVFVGVLAAVTGAYYLFIVIPEQRGQVVVRRRMRWENPTATTTAGVQLLKKQQVLSSIQSFDNALKRFDSVSGPLNELVEQSGLKLTVGQFLLVTLVSLLAGVVLVQWRLGIWWVSVLAGGTTGILPFAIVKQVRAFRILKFEEQFPEAIQLIARAM